MPNNGIIEDSVLKSIYENCSKLIEYIETIKNPLIYGVDEDITNEASELLSFLTITSFYNGLDLKFSER